MVVSVGSGTEDLCRPTGSHEYPTIGERPDAVGSAAELHRPLAFAAEAGHVATIRAEGPHRVVGLIGHQDVALGVKGDLADHAEKFRSFVVVRSERQHRGGVQQPVAGRAPRRESILGEPRRNGIGGDERGVRRGRVFGSGVKDLARCQFDVAAASREGEEEEGQRREELRPRDKDVLTHAATLLIVVGCLCAH